MFHPNAPVDSDDPYQSREELWQKSRQTTVTAILENQTSCKFCGYIVQLFEDRIHNQDVLLQSLQELGAAGAKVSVGYRNEPACNPNLMDWELTRLEVALKLPEAAVTRLRERFGVDPHLDNGPNLFVVLQSAGEGGKTLQESMDRSEDFASWYEEEESGYELDADCLGEGRLRTPVFDPEVVHYWMELCEEKHQIHPRSPCRGHQMSIVDRIFDSRDYEKNQVPGLRVIDVDNMCIVEYDWDRSEPYFALSYVWGTQRFVTLNKANEADLARQGSLSSIQLPDTIADAINVMAQLEKNYLWVDSLCILQDDKADQARFISRMGTIYQQADVTIIALCGEDAYAGLPGVREDAPRIEQQGITVKGVSILPVMMPTGWGDAYKLGETKWTTRAWTHQETLLSRRRLIFGREQAYFICQSTWCEDVVGLDFTPFIDTFALLQLIASLRHFTGSRERHFRDLVTAYTKKQLTQRQDRLNGISGMLEELSKFVGPFFQGVPLACFSNAILWDRDFIWTGAPRAIDEKYCQDEKDMRISKLPSWSWVGWLYHVRFGKDFDEDPPRRLRFYGFTRDAGLEELETDEHKRAQKDEWGSDTGGWGQRNDMLPDEFWNQERTEVTLEDLAGLKPTTPLLCFWTWTAKIRLEVNGKKKFFTTATGRSVGIGLRVFVPPGQVQDLELIVIGDFTYIQLNHKPAVAVIAIRWDEGIAYREPFGLETVAYSDWQEIEGRCWKRIIMG